MEVTSDNFVALLPVITETIKDCDFIAIDTELSGLMRGKRNNWFDCPKERFGKDVESSKGYFIMQFGLSCFTKTDKLHFNNTTYNFYIFPQANQQFCDIDRTFLIQSHAIRFLIGHGFDFNKLFSKGVSYVTFEEKKTITAQLRTENKNRNETELGSNGLPKFVPSRLEETCKKWLRKVNEFVEQQKTIHKPRLDASSDCEMTTSDETNQLKLVDCSTTHKRTIMKRILECQPNFKYLEICSDVPDSQKNDTSMVLRYIDREKKEENQRRALIEAKGFLEIIEQIIVNKKPLVGHNLSIDLIQIINQFLKPLDQDYDSFKHTCHTLFPLIYDTKYIANLMLESDTTSQTRLNDLYNELRVSKTYPKIIVKHLNGEFDENQLPHQAGFDAYMSGYCFALLCEKYIRDKKKFKYMKEEPGTKPNPVAQDSEVVKDFGNKIYLSYSYDYKCFDLGKSEEEPDRKHVFYLEHPSSWQLDDIYQLFHEIGGVKSCKLSDTTALCALREPNNLSQATNMTRNRGMSSYKVYTYDEYVRCFKPSNNGLNRN